MLPQNRIRTRRDLSPPTNTLEYTLILPDRSTRVQAVPPDPGAVLYRLLEHVVPAGSAHLFFGELTGGADLYHDVPGLCLALQKC